MPQQLADSRWLPQKRASCLWICSVQQDEKQEKRQTFSFNRSNESAGRICWTLSLVTVIGSP